MKHLLLAVSVILLFTISCAHRQRPVIDGVGLTTATASLTSDRPASRSLVVAQNDAEEDEAFYEELDAEEDVTIADPLIYWNKAMYHVNDKLYFWVLKPVAQGYKAITPHFFRTGVRNFFTNLGYPVRFVGSVLQGKIGRAGQETARFFVNTTAGVGGLFNPAKSNPGLNPPAEDIGQAFAVWGIGDGFYIVWPIFGPSTPRDTVAMVAEHFLDPVTYLALVDGEGLWEGDARYYATGANALRMINATSFRIGDYEALKEAAIDPYEALKDAYLQNRRKKIRE